MTALEQINEIADQLPAFILQDVDKRIQDHLVTGGGHDDHYIHQQLRYARNVIRGVGRHATTNNL